MISIPIIYKEGLYIQTVVGPWDSFHEQEGSAPPISFELAAPGLVRTGALNRPVHKPWGKGWSLRAGLAPAIYFHHNQKSSTKQRLHTLFWMTFAGLFQGG